MGLQKIIISIVTIVIVALLSSVLLIFVANNVFVAALIIVLTFISIAIVFTLAIDTSYTGELVETDEDHFFDFGLDEGIEDYYLHKIVELAGEQYDD